MINAINVAIIKVDFLLRSSGIRSMSSLLFDNGNGNGNGNGDGGDRATEFLTEWNGQGGGSMDGANQTVKNVGGDIYGVLFNVALIGAAIALIITGLKLMLGGAQSKAESKTTLIWICFGVALVVGSIGIVGIIAKATKSIAAP